MSVPRHCSRDKDRYSEAGRPNAVIRQAASKAMIWTRSSPSLSRTEIASGRQVVWPGRRRKPAAGCPLAAVGRTRQVPGEVMTARSAAATSGWPFHSPPCGRIRPHY